MNLKQNCQRNCVAWKTQPMAEGLGDGRAIAKKLIKIALLNQLKPARTEARARSCGFGFSTTFALSSAMVLGPAFEARMLAPTA